MHTNSIIYSTEGNYTKNNLIKALVLYFVGAFSWLYLSIDYIDSPIVIIIFLVLLIVMLIPVNQATQMKQSYVKLHDCFISGKTVSSKPYSNDGGISFTLKYEEIINVDTQKDIVRIYFNGGTYWVQAKEAETIVVDIINQKKHINPYST